MSQAEARFRYRICFAKTEAMRFTGHLDLHRAWERAFRRAGLPLAYGRGFTPHAKIQLACALPLGFVGEQELIDAWLEQPLDPEEVLRRLRAAAPPGIDVRAARSITTEESSLQQQVVEADYEIDLPEGVGPSEIHTRLSELLGQPSLPRVRRGKPYDLRPLIQSAVAELCSDGLTRLRLRLLAKEGATGRPEEILAALGVDPALALIRRLRLHLSES